MAILNNQMVLIEGQPFHSSPLPALNPHWYQLPPKVDKVLRWSVWGGDLQVLVTPPKKVETYL